MNALENRKKTKSMTPQKYVQLIILGNHSWYQIMPRHCTFIKLSIQQISNILIHKY